MRYLYFKQINQSMGSAKIPSCSLLVVCLCILSISSLRLKSNEQLHMQNAKNEEQQLKYLVGLQNNYAEGIKTLSSNALSARSSLNDTTNVQDRIKILENAITSERSKIGTLSTKIIPDPNSGYFQCQTLSLDKQNSWIAESNQIQNRIAQLEELTKLVPDCDQIKAIRDEISKSKINLGSLKKTVANQCQQNLAKSQTVYQTNLYQNNNWTLGSMSMDQLIDQYYQRSLKYTNITNCPLNKPFMPSVTPATSINSCIQCSDSNRPYFDMSTRSCVSCGSEKELDSSTRKCGFLQKNSNYTLGPNYKLDPLTAIPAPNSNLTSCPSDRPFYNNTLCIACPLPNFYWQISESKCVQCPSNTEFNINSHACVTKITNALTVLDGNEWVTNDGNITRPYELRNRKVSENKTTKKYFDCNQSTPFYDNLSCVTCEKGLYFNVDTLKCVAKPQNLAYDNNMHAFVKPVNNYEMDPNAPRYISNQPVLDDANIPNCNVSYPYFDQVSCITCRQPFPLFNYDTKQCVKCNDRFMYSQTTKKCQSKPPIYVYGNTDNLLATNKTSIADYNRTLKESIEKNPQMYPETCPNSDQHPAISKCVKCNSGQYFNVENYTCTVCDGQVDAQTSLCRQRMYYFVNTNASNLILPPNVTIQDVQANIDRRVKQNPQKYSICNLTNPLPSNNQTQCGNCQAPLLLFNISSQECTQCPENWAYDQSSMSCREIYYLTNLDRNVIVSQPQTLDTYVSKQKEVNKTKFTKKCPQDKPYAQSPTICIDCESNKYFDLKTSTCTGCSSTQTYDVVSKACVETKYLTDFRANKILQQQNYTKQNVQSQYQSLSNANNSGIKIVNCTINNQKPYATTSGCIDCPDNNTYFSLKTQSCVGCPPNSQYWPASLKCIYQINTTNFDNKPKIIQAENYTLANYKNQTEELKKSGPWKACPSDRPFSINGLCQACPEPNSYFYLSNKTCGACDNYYEDLNTCPPRPSRYPNLSNFQWITNDGNADRIINRGMELKDIANGDMCPEFYDQKTKICVNCPETLYYNYDNATCQRCPEGTMFDINIHMCASKPIGNFQTNTTEDSNRNFIYGGYTFSQLQTNINQTLISSNGQSCPSETPYFDTIKCVKCPDYKKYFNLRYSLCQICLNGQVLKQNDCYLGNDKVWKRPDPEKVYQFLYGQK